MDRLKTIDNGGFPWELDDWRWHERGIDQAFSGLTKSLSAGADYILSGCVITISVSAPTTTYTITEGYAVIDGEICYVPAVTSPTVAAGAVAYFGKVISFDAAGNEAFEDGVTRGTYQKTQGGIIGAASIPSGRLNATALSGANGDIRLPKQIVNRIINERFDFGARIKVHPKDGTPETISSAQGGSLDFLNFNNNFELVFNGTSPDLFGFSGPSSSDGMFCVVRFHKSSGSKQYVRINHLSGVAGLRHEFWTRSQKDILVYDGELVYFFFDGTYWHVTSEHAPASDNFSPSGAGWSSGLKLRKNGNGLITIEGLIQHNSYTSGVNVVYGVVPNEFLPIGFVTSAIVTDGTNLPGRVFIAGFGGDAGKVQIIVPGLASATLQAQVLMHYYQN